METVTEQIVPVEAQRVVEATEVMVKTYDNYAIESSENYSGAGEHLKIIKSKAKELDNLRKSLTQPLDESKKRIMGFFKKPLEYLANAEAAVKSAMLKWQQKQEAIRRAEEQRLAEIQRKEAERLEREARAAEEKANKLKTEKAKAAAEERAKELREKAETVTSIAPAVESKVEEVNGISTKKIWKFRIVDVNKIPRKYMVPDEKLIGKMGRVTNGKEQIDGVEFYSEDVISART